MRVPRPTGRHPHHPRRPPCPRPLFPFRDRRHHGWDNRSDTATLRNHRDRVIDEASWDEHHSRNGARHHGHGGDRH
ncbi:hypothetical protein [Streptomyces sp. NPDC058335]|uniref:hypothetical protein n=1 Tax=Streptomyces sp. NPDC058335 TaxID=3346451 RepID=UPI00364BA759